MNRRPSYISLSCLTAASLAMPLLASTRSAVTRALIFAVVVSGSFFGTAAFTAPAVAAGIVPAIEARAVWVAERDGVLKVASESGELVFEIRDVVDLRAIAVDATRRSIWVAHPGGLVRFDTAGERQVDVELQIEESAPSIALDPRDGSVWLAHDTELLSFGFDGQPFHNLPIDPPARALALDDKNGRLYVATRNGLVGYDAITAQPLRLPEIAASLSELDVDSRGRLWAVAGDAIFVLEGRALFESPEAVAMRTIARTASRAQKIATHPASGLFALEQNELVRRSDDGVELWRQSLTEDGVLLRDLVISEDGSVLWASSRERLFKVSKQGEVLARVSFAPPARIRALAYDPGSDPVAKFELAEAGLENYLPIEPDALVLPTVQARRGAVFFPAGTVPPRALVEVRAIGGRVLGNTRAASNGSGGILLAARKGEELFLSAHDERGGDVYGTPLLLIEDEEDLFPIPPNPEDEARATPENLAYDLYENVRFLWEGGHETGLQIQTGVSSDHLISRRTTVVRGRVLDENGDPRPGVMISVYGDAELDGEFSNGMTVSRADGRFDFAVNGGGWEVLELWHEDYLVSHRQLPIDRRRFTDLDAIRLVPKPDSVHVMANGGTTAIQVIEGAQETDQDGTRQLRLFFPEGVTADLLMPDGSTVPIAEFDVRVKEFTVGEGGPEAMPASLPAFSAYTFAYDVLIDQVESNDAVSIVFDQPVPQYVENFLDMPLGEGVPVGYYDPRQTNWVTEPDGRVIEIAGVDPFGRAELYVDPPENCEPGPCDPPVIADAARLAELGITDAEREKLADPNLYAVGQSLWRVASTHFCYRDWNWGFGFPTGALLPPDIGQDPQEGLIDHPCLSAGSIIECESQVLRETVPVVGTPFSLNYTSNRAPGRKVERVWDIVVTDDREYDGPPIVIDLKIEVAGKVYRESWDEYQKNITHHFEWDGLDVYGREVQGNVKAVASLAYGYKAVYIGGVCNSDEACGGGFGGPGGPRVVRDTSRDLVAYKVIGEKDLWMPVPAPIGGWSLDVHHQYVPEGGRLLRGDGEIRGVQSFTSILTLVAGGGDQWQDGTPEEPVEATDTELWGLQDVVHLPAGGYLIAEGEQNRIRYVSPDGFISTFAGNGQSAWEFENLGDGGPATEAKIGNPLRVAMGPDGSVYVCHWPIFGFFNKAYLRRISPDGTISTIVGQDETHSACTDVAVSPDGHVYFSTGDTSENSDDDHSIFRIEEDIEGNVEFFRFAGTGEDGDGSDYGDDAYTHNTALDRPQGLAFDPAGNLYFVDNNADRVLRVETDGRIRVVAGTGETGDEGDGVLALDADLNELKDVAINPEGEVYFTDRYTASPGSRDRVRKVSPDGFIRNAAGKLDRETGITGTPATAQKLTRSNGLSWDPEGRLVISQEGGKEFEYYHRGKVWRMGGIFPDYDEVEYGLASRDGREIYFFDRYGKHLSTKHPETGASLYELIYDTVDEDPDYNERLIGVRDVAGRVTDIVYDQAGQISIVSPDNQTTTFQLDTDGRLEEITNPAGETITLNTGSFHPVPSLSRDGLLLNMADPRGQEFIHTYEYDDLGFLIFDGNPEGGSTTLVRSKLLDENDKETGDIVTKTSAMGIETQYIVNPKKNGDEVRTQVLPGGYEVKTERRTNGEREITQPDGTKITWVERPDPRLGMTAPILDDFTITTPIGRLSPTVKRTREIEMSDPDNLVAIESIVDTVQLNERPEATLEYQKSEELGIGGEWTITSPMLRKSTVQLDPEGRVKEAQLADYKPVVYSYDSSGRLEKVTQGDGENMRETMYSYHAGGPTKGYLETVRDPVQETVDFDWDLGGRLDNQTLADANVIDFGYDPAGNMTSLTPPGRQAHRFHYTGVDLTDGYAPPALPDPVGNTFTRYEYNDDQQLVDIIRPDGRNVHFEYSDIEGRLESVEQDDLFGSYFLQYENGTNGLQDTGKLHAILGPELGQTITYDYDGPLVTSVAWSGPVEGSVEMSYTGDLWPKRQEINGDYGVDYTFDDDGLLEHVGDLDLLRNVDTGFLEGTTLDSVTDTYGYDPDFGELNLYRAEHAVEGVLFEETITERDKLGRISRKTETVLGVSTDYRYVYDPRGRLIEVYKNSQLSEQYNYDGSDGANGNRTSWTVDGQFRSAAFDSQDRLLTAGDVSYEYLAGGELFKKRQGSVEETYFYDAFSNLRSVALSTGITLEYVVDGANRRVGRKVNGTYTHGWIYQDQLNPVAELNALGEVAKRFVYGSREHVPDYYEDLANPQNPVIYRLFSDHLGSVRLVVDTATGIVAQRLDYDGFGRVVADTAPGFQPFGFAGGLYDHQTRLVRFGARDYDPELGRWNSKDPVGFLGLDANLYGYVFNDPINLVDPTGNAAILAIAAGVWVVVEAAGSAIDVYDFAKALLNPCSTTADIGVSAAGLGLGFIAPGGGYGRWAKWAKNRGVALAEAAGLFPKKIGAGGKLQPYSLLTGRYVKNAKTFAYRVTKSVASTPGQFAVGFSEGLAASTGVPVPSTNVARSRSLGRLAGEVAGNIGSLF